MKRVDNSVNLLTSMFVWSLLWYIMENDSAQFDGHIAGIYVTSSDALKLQPALVVSPAENETYSNTHCKRMWLLRFFSRFLWMSKLLGALEELTNFSFPADDQVFYVQHL